MDPGDRAEKFNVPGVNVIAGAGGGAPSPVPVSGTDCGLPGALSVTVNCPRREPDAVGVKVTVMRQDGGLEHRGRVAIVDLTEVTGIQAGDTDGVHTESLVSGAREHKRLRWSGNTDGAAAKN